MGALQRALPAMGSFYQQLSLLIWEPFVFILLPALGYKPLAVLLVEAPCPLAWCGLSGGCHSAKGAGAFGWGLDDEPVWLPVCQGISGPVAMWPNTDGMAD